MRKVEKNFKNMPKRFWALWKNPDARKYKSNGLGNFMLPSNFK
jgi:hypothetical protein